MDDFQEESSAQWENGIVEIKLQPPQKSHMSTVETLPCRCGSCDSAGRSTSINREPRTTSGRTYLGSRPDEEETTRSSLQKVGKVFRATQWQAFVGHFVWADNARGNRLEDSRLPHGVHRDGIQFLNFQFALEVIRSASVLHERLHAYDQPFKPMEAAPGTTYVDG